MKPIDKSYTGAIRFATNSWTHVGYNPLSSGTVTWTNEFHGVTNDQWKARIRHYDDVTSGFWARSISCVKRDGYIESNGWVNNSKTPANLRTEGKAGTIFHSASALYPSGDSGLARARLMASSNFWDEVQSALRAIEGGELLGELGQTAKAVKSTATGMLNLLLDWKRFWRNVKRGNRRLSKRQLLGHAGDAYLQWKFGWDPLQKDVATLANGLKNDYYEVIPITARGRGTGNVSTATTQLGQIGCNYDMVTLEKSYTKCRFDAGLLVHRVGVGALAERLGIHPRNNFLPTLYNLLPWTYMLDYFTNMGSLINAMSNMGCRFSYKSFTFVSRREITYVTGVAPRIADGLGWINAPGYPIVQPSFTKWESKYVQRGQGGPDAWPELQFRMPSVLNDGGRWQWGNIAAVLAAQAFGNSTIASYG